MVCPRKSNETICTTTSPTSPIKKRTTMSTTKTTTSGALRQPLENSTIRIVRESHFAALAIVYASSPIERMKNPSKEGFLNVITLPNGDQIAEEITELDDLVFSFLDVFCPHCTNRNAEAWGIL